MLALAAGGALAAVPANALPLPTCSTTSPITIGSAGSFDNAQHCWYNTGTGNAGYLGGNDGHTHYRFVTTNVTNNPQLVDLDGVTLNGAVGDEVCDSNNHTGGAGGWAAEIGLFGNIPGAPHQANTVFYAAGFWAAGAPDPCANKQPLVTAPNSTTNCPPGGAGSVTGISPAVFCGSFTDGSGHSAVLPGDVLDGLAVYYVPGSSHHNQISFGFCDATQGFCTQAYTHGVHSGSVIVNLNEFGIGAFSQSQMLGAPASILLENFTGNEVNCYSCHSGPVNIITVQPVNTFGAGGLEEGQTDNTSGQATMSPNNSLTPSGFTIYNGSTSV